MEADGVRYVLRKNESEAARVRHRLDDKLATLARNVDQRNDKVKKSPRCRPEAGRQRLQAWVARHKLTGLVNLHLEDGAIVVVRQEERLERALDLAGCYAVVTDVAAERMSDQAVHDTYVSLQRVERDFRQVKTGLLEVRPAATYACDSACLKSTTCVAITLVDPAANTGSVHE